MIENKKHYSTNKSKIRGGIFSAWQGPSRPPCTPARAHVWREMVPGRTHGCPTMVTDRALPRFP